MNPASNHTTSRLVCEARSALNGIHGWSTSSPTWAKAMKKPYTSCSANSNMQVAKKAQATFHDSNLRVCT